MTPRQWRQRGYKTIFRDGERYLYRPEALSAFLLPPTEGMWADEDNTAALEPVDLYLDQWQDFQRTTAACYCDQGVDTCDFCAGLRTPPGTRAHQ